MRASARPKPTATGAESRCSVAGCPGVLDDAGECASCALRAAYREKYLPTKACEICEGTIAVGRGRPPKYCDACTNLAAEIEHRKKARA